MTKSRASTNTIKYKALSLLSTYLHITCLRMTSPMDTFAFGANLHTFGPGMPYSDQQHWKKCHPAAKHRWKGRKRLRQQQLGNRSSRPAREVTRIETVQELKSSKWSLDPIQKVKMVHHLRAARGDRWKTQVLRQKCPKKYSIHGEVSCLGAPPSCPPHCLKCILYRSVQRSGKCYSWTDQDLFVCWVNWRAR